MPKPGQINNPKGKGGFGDNPQNRSDGRWSKETSVSYWYNYFLALSVDEFMDYPNKNPKNIRYVACEIAYKAVAKARDEINYLRELTDRTEGKPRQDFGHDHRTSEGLQIEFKKWKNE